MNINNLFKCNGGFHTLLPFFLGLTVLLVGGFMNDSSLPRLKDSDYLEVK